MRRYVPKPIDTSRVRLTKNLVKLRERLAENAHDHWARMRFEEGWEPGTARDERGKRNPNLVPYRRLGESEKRYDRVAAMETLKAILALGYRISRVRRNALRGRSKPGRKRG